jgi:hypothetical protein
MIWLFLACSPAVPLTVPVCSPFTNLSLPEDAQITACTEKPIPTLIASTRLSPNAACGQLRSHALEKGWLTGSLPQSSGHTMAESLHQGSVVLDIGCTDVAGSTTITLSWKDSNPLP